MSDDTPTRESTISLREITNDNLLAVFQLKTTAAQEQFVATVPWSIAQASLQPRSWQRAIYADDTPVGYVLMFIRPHGDSHDGEPEYYLWRFLID